MLTRSAQPRHWLDGIFVLLLIVALTFVVVTQADEPTVAESLIPFGSLSETNRALVRAVTDHYTLRCEYGARTLAARTDQFEFLMSNMAATSALAQKGGLILYRVEPDTDGRMHADDREGADGWMLRMFTCSTQCVYYVEGQQRGIFQVRGRGVAVVDFKAAADGKIEYTGALFVKVDNRALAALAQVFSIFVRSTVDRQFDNVLRLPIALGEAASANPEKLLCQIEEMHEADRKLLAPLTEMIRCSLTNDSARGRNSSPTVNPSP